MVIPPPPTPTPSRRVDGWTDADGCGQRGYDGGFGDVNNATDTAGGGDGTAAAAAAAVAAAKCTTVRAIDRDSSWKERRRK